MSRGQPLDLSATARVRAVLSVAAAGCWGLDAQVDQVRRQALKDVEDQLSRGLEKAVECGHVNLVSMEIESILIAPRSSLQSRIVPELERRPAEPHDRASGLLREFVRIWAHRPAEQRREALDELFKAVEHFLRTGELLP